MTSPLADRARGACVLALCALVCCALPGAADGRVMVFGSPLSGPATRNTSADLGYRGTYTPVPPSPQAPNGYYHTSHWGADTALWNVSLPGGRAAAPASGDAAAIRLEGCAQRARGGPRPLTQIHFQDLAPVAGGGVRVKLTSQPFDIPVCGEHGAHASTVTSYRPLNLCVARGDFIAFNDEGGYVPLVYRSGVAYEVIRTSRRARMDSFVRANGTNNGSMLSSSYTSANDGFAANAGEELAMSVTLATGRDAVRVCRHA